MADAQTQLIKLALKDGRHIHGVSYGSPSSKEKVLCIHGLGVDSNVWQFVAALYCELDMQVICLDLPGHGLSETTPWRKLNAKAMAEDLFETCTRLQIRPRTIIAQSFGNLVLLELLPQILAHWHVHRIVAVTPVWGAKRLGTRAQFRAILRALKFGYQVGKAMGFRNKPIKERRDHTLFAGFPDHHMPRFAAEAQSIGWLRYLWLMLLLQASRGKVPDWGAYKDVPITIIGAEHEGLWDNGQLTEISRLSGWPLRWMDMCHVSLSTEAPYAERLIRLLQTDGVIK